MGLYCYSYHKECKYEQGTPYLEHISELLPYDTDCLRLLIECWQNLVKVYTVKLLKKRVLEINR